jgi:hypothetical protein
MRNHHRIHNFLGFIHFKIPFFCGHVSQWCDRLVCKFIFPAVSTGFRTLTNRGPLWSVEAIYK